MNLLDLGDDKFKSVKVKGHKFKIRYMSPEDLLRITRRRIDLVGGSSIETMTESEYLHAQSMAIVDICVEDMPEKFNPNESCIRWGDRELIYELAEAIRNHTAEIEAKLKKNRPLEGSTEE